MVTLVTVYSFNLLLNNVLASPQKKHCQILLTWWSPF